MTRQRPGRASSSSAAGRAPPPPSSPRGGGFAYVGSLHEGFPYAVAINAEGTNAFVLRYRPGVGERAAEEDLAAAIATVFRHAPALGIGTARYPLWGSSAGARMAANIGSHGTAAFGGDDLPGPACVVMAYTAHADHTRKEPATFALVGERDGIAPPPVMERRVAALRGRHAGRVPRLSWPGPRLRPRRGHGRRGLDRRRHAVLAGER